jgi:pimeloyl-[acyl-carrier protein] methyl ester esterase
MRLNTIETGQGQPLVLLHGWGLHGGVWDTLVPLLAPRFRCIVIDLPGHGESPPVEGGLDAWADACLAVAPPRARWLGWSLGGMIALAAALQKPVAIERLFLVATTPRFVTAPDWPHAVAPEMLAQFAAELEADWRRTVEKFLILQTLGGTSGTAVLRALRAMVLGRVGADRAGLVTGLRILETADLRARLGEISAPVQVLTGAHDRLTPAAAARALAAALDGEFTAMPGAAHAPFLSDPAAFVRGIDAATVAA